jgi:hypothetical protein
VLTVVDNTELLKSQTHKLQEMILSVADGLDTTFIKFLPRPSLSQTPKV